MKLRKPAGILSACVISICLSPLTLHAKEMYAEKEEVRLIVTYGADATDGEKEEVLSQSGVDKQDVVEDFPISHTTVIEVAKEDAEQVQKRLRENPEVCAVQPDYTICVDDFDISAACYHLKDRETVTVSDPYYSLQWGMKNTGQQIYLAGIHGVDSNVEKAWMITAGSEEVLVGVLDTGIDINSIEIRENIYVNKREIPGNGIDDDGNGYIDDVNGWDFYHDDATVYDSAGEDSHGTFVASIIGASRNGLGMVGVSPKVKIVPLKFMCTEDGGSTSDAIRAIEYAASLGVKVINCSWAGTTYNPALEAAMRHSDILFICASGNQGKDIDASPVYPACFHLKNVITVGAINNQGDMTAYSNYGRRNVDVLAPGDGIIGLAPGNMLMLSDGTSAAAPFVAGEAALIYSVKPEIKADKVADYITKSVVREKKRYQEVKSGGRIDIYQAIRFAQNIHRK